MTPEIAALSWPGQRLAAAVEALVDRCGLAGSAAGGVPPAPDSPIDGAEAERLMETIARALDVDAEPVRPRHSEAPAFIRTATPAVMFTSLDGCSSFLVAIGRRRGRLLLLGPDHRVVAIAECDVIAALREEKELPVRAEVSTLLDRASIGGRRRQRVATALIADRLTERRLSVCWMFRPKVEADVVRAAWTARLPQYLVGVLTAHVLQFTIFIASWLVLARATFSGGVDPGWMVAWGLLIASMVPLRLLEAWWQGVFSIRAGIFLRSRLMRGSLRLDPDGVRHRGVGHSFGLVVESEMVESLAQTGAVLGFVATADLLFAFVVLGLGAGGFTHVILLIVWTWFVGLLALWHYRARRRWVKERIALTHDLVEKMVGHRTRLAQQSAADWHREEDGAHLDYLETSSKMDRYATLLRAIAPRGWLLLGVAGLIPAFMSSADVNSMAIAVGGILLAHRAFEEAVLGIEQLSGAFASGREIIPVLDAAANEPLRGDATLAVTQPAKDATLADATTERDVLIDACHLEFRYRDRARPVLADATLRIRQGDRLLLEGPSGGGKSTLASILTGVREPQGGLLLLSGLDRRTWGADAWRRRVATAPQFHDNHVFSDTFAFNLLFARQWPPSGSDLAEAETICKELGLGDLLRRMPGGLHQMVGASGWRLSHGEQSRLFIARTLLQGSELMILDESFGALDPETMASSLRCVLRRARTLVVIAHP